MNLHLEPAFYNLFSLTSLSPRSSFIFPLLLRLSISPPTFSTALNSSFPRNFYFSPPLLFSFFPSSALLLLPSNPPYLLPLLRSSFSSTTFSSFLLSFPSYLSPLSLSKTTISLTFTQANLVS